MVTYQHKVLILGRDLQSTPRTTTMYIQYFCKKLFSGAGATSSPSAVSGGGVRNSGLVAH